MTLAALVIQDWIDSDKKKKRSAADFARKAKLAPSTVSEILNHKKTPSLETALKIAEEMDPEPAMEVLYESEPSLRKVVDRYMSSKFSLV